MLRLKNGQQSLVMSFNFFGSDVLDNGSGLGIVIAKKIIEFYDGSLLIESSKKALLSS